MTPAPGSPAEQGLDHGLQQERTAMAWRRTCLAVVTGGVLALRLLPERYGVPGLALALAACG